MKESPIKDQIIIRPMTDEDVYAASGLEESVFSMPWKAEDFLEMVKATYAHYFVAQLDGKLVGIIGLRDIVGEGEITNVAVDSNYRRHGIGKLLMKEVLNKCDELGIKDVTLEVRVSNEAAIRLYEGFNFKSEGVRPRFYEHPTEDALIMWKRYN